MVVNLVLTLALVASTPAAAAASPSGPHTLQQDFDEASAEASAGNCESAITKFDALGRNPKIRPGSLPAAAIAVRKGICVIKLGLADADETSMRSGLAVLEKAGSGFDIDVADGWSALGDAAFWRYDYAEATAAYKNGLTRLEGKYRLKLLGKLARSTAFDGDAEALSYADESIKLISAMSKPDKNSLAAYHTLHARTLLNQGNVEEAYKELKTALSLSGGLTRRTTLDEVALRSDLAMAAMLVGRKDDARLYLAYTGAGRIEKSPFTGAVSMNPPLCGEETGLRPDDVAVVEFRIADDGTVASAQTVYTRGGPAVATAFSRAVSEWYWKPEDIKAIPPFYRLLTRVELRCSNVLGDGPGVMGPLRARFFRWASRRLPSVDAIPDTGSAKFQEILQILHRSASLPDDMIRIAALGSLAYAEPASGSKRVALADEALGLTAKTPVPQEVVNWLRIVRLLASTSDKSRRSRGDLNDLLTLAEDPLMSKDALAADTLRLKAARGWMTTKLKEAPALLNEVAQDDRLPPHHPLRQLAWLDLAGKAAEDGNRTAAQGYFSQTGLTNEQCALLGEAPTLKRSNVSSSDYPTEALMMGFEGWVQTEYDIMTDGRTTNARAIIVYPPLIFAKAAAGMTEDLRYDVSFRPGSSLACSANRETIKFVIPRNH